MVGALVLSRAAAGASRPFADEMLSAPRSDLLRAVGDKDERAPARRNKASVKGNAQWGGEA
jgi:hypothetical protein